MTLPAPHQPCLGIDIGGTTTHGVVLDDRSRVIAELVRPTETGPAAVIAIAALVARECLLLAGETTGELGSIGVGVPGRVDHRTGLVTTAVNLGIERLELGAQLTHVLGAPVCIDNDVKATALGAADHLQLQDANLTYLNFGTGVASATLVGGRLVRGEGNLAGEIGHVPIDPAAGRCGCGQFGCIEVLAGGGRIAERLAPSGLSLDTLLARADAGDGTAAMEAERIATGIATAVQLAVLAHGSTQVVLGGGVISTAPGLIDRARLVLAGRAAQSRFLDSLDLPGRIRVLPARHPLAAIGAALVGRQRLGLRQPAGVAL